MKTPKLHINLGADLEYKTACRKLVRPGQVEFATKVSLATCLACLKKLKKTNQSARVIYAKLKKISPNPKATWRPTRDFTA